MEKLKIEILRNSKELSLDEVHSFLKVLGFPVQSNYEQYSTQDYLSTSISSVNEEAKLRALLDSFKKEIQESFSNIKWRESHYRLFISHRSEYKKEVNDLKEILFYYGVHGFVAHEDIEVSSQWRDSLMGALKTSHAVLAYITDDFAENSWCSQEVGYACINNLKVIPLKLSVKNPSGFLSFYQAANGHSLSIFDKATLIASKLLDIDFNNFYECLLYSIRSEANFSKTKYILELLVNSKVVLSVDHLDRLEKIVYSDTQIIGYAKSIEYLKIIKENVK